MVLLGTGCGGAIESAPPPYQQPNPNPPAGPVTPQPPEQTPPGGSTKPPEPGTPVATPSLEMSTTELVPVTLRLDDPAAQFNGIPEGALFEPATQTMRWIPSRGQAGQHQIYFSRDGTSHTVKVTVNPISEPMLQAGPPALYEDGEVGYIFIHGKSDADLCVDRGALNDYWGGTINSLAPVLNSRSVVCYDGRQAVANQALHVANQIVDASCGSFGRCIIVVHSMGGLMIEHILHQAPANPTFAAAKRKMLFVLAVASAAGGSKAADMVIHPSAYAVAQEAIGRISDFFGAAEGSTQNLVPSVAAQVAPLDANSGIPIFMIAGYSPKIVTNGGDIGDYLGSLVGSGDREIFNGDTRYAALDLAVSFRARSDGIVSLRSSCGIASSDMAAGPARSAPLGEHFAYCAQTPKKPNHYPWLLASQNHSNIVLPAANCSKDGCLLHIFDPTSSSFVESPIDARQGAMVAVRRLMHERSRSGGLQRTDLVVDLSTGMWQ